MENLKKSLVFILIIFIVGMFSCTSPNSTTENYSVNVSGSVLRKSGAPLDSVVVTLNNPLRKDTTEVDGTFKYTFTSSEANEVTTTMRFSRNDFFDTVITVAYSSTKKNLALGEIFMSGLTPAIDSIPPPKKSTRAGTVVLQNISSPSISIKGAGGIDYSSLVFEVRDSLGVPIDENNKVTVNFRLVTKPDNLTYFNVDSIKTNAGGAATVILYAGQKAGIAQVRAFATVKNSSDTTKLDTLKSPIVSVPIYGGFADSSHVTISTSKVNLPAGIPTVTSTIAAVIGDKFGNPVQPKTPVYFGTNGGIVSPGSAVTDASGKVSVTLSPVNPIPLSGIATVTANIGSGVDGAISAGNNTFSVLQRYANSKNLGIGKIAKVASIVATNVTVLFSGATVINSNDNNFVLPANGTQNVSFTVGDQLGNPLAEGTTISVTGVGTDSIGIILNGDLTTTLPDTRDKSFTSFSVGVKDQGNGNWTEGTKIGLSVNVKSPNGNAKKIITGYLGKAAIDTTGVPASARQPAQIAFIGSTANNIYVSGVGATEMATLTYAVRDSLGAPLDQNHSVGVTFATQFFPNSFTGGGTAPSILPTIDSSDAQGQVHVTVVSGTQAGVVQLIASLATPSKTIVSQPTKISVYSGFADQRHFTIAAPYYNFPGLQKALAPSLTVNVGIGDAYSNPVAPGTQVYFNSSHGTITGGAPTDARGFTSATLTPGNPYPTPPDTLAGMPRGYGRIYARTIGKNGALILDSILILWTGSPVITNTGTTTFTVANGGGAGPFTFSVSDIYGHPLSAGTTISVSANAGVVDGGPWTLYDTFATGNGITTFSVNLKDDNTTDINPAVPATLRVTVTHPVYGTYELILASGTVD